MTDRTPTQRALDAEAQVVDLARENEKLREALEKIAAPAVFFLSRSDAIWMRATARAALKEIGK